MLAVRDFSVLPCRSCLPQFGVVLLAAKFAPLLQKSLIVRMCTAAFPLAQRRSMNLAKQINFEGVVRALATSK